MSDATNEIKQTALKVLKVIGSDFAFSLFRAEDLEDISESVGMFTSDMQDAIADKEVMIHEDEKKWVAMIIGNILTTIILKPISDEVKEMALAYALLAKNWNQIAQEHEVERRADSLISFINYHQSVVATIEVLKRLTENAEKVAMCTPPAWEVSRHYLLSLREKLEKRNEDEQ